MSHNNIQLDYTLDDIGNPEDVDATTFLDATELQGEEQQGIGLTIENPVFGSPPCFERTPSGEIRPYSRSPFIGLRHRMTEPTEGATRNQTEFDQTNSSPGVCKLPRSAFDQNG